MTTSLKDALEHARSEAQQLHQRLDAATTQHTAALRTELQKSVEHAEAIAATLRESSSKQSAEAKRHVDEAATALRDAADQAKTAATAGETQIKNAAAAANARVREALSSITQAVAENRASATAGKK